MMHKATNVAVLAATLLDLILANPFPSGQLAKRGDFSIDQVKVGGDTPSGPLALQRVYEKYGIKVPDSVSSAVGAVNLADVGPQGSAPAQPEANDDRYLVPVTVDGTELMLDFDTGSSDLWVFSSLQPSDQLVGHSFYNASSKQPTGQSWGIGYADKSGASGQVYSGSVTVGSVTATRQAIEAATSISTRFTQERDLDGFVGLAFSSKNTVKPGPENTFFDNVKEQLSQPLFTAALKYKAAGSYDFGFIDSSKYTGTLQYARVDKSSGFWSVGVNGFAVGTGTKTPKTQFAAYVDTGTTLLLLPQDLVAAYYKAVPSAQYSWIYGGYVYPCSTQLPSLSLSIDTGTYTIPNQFLTYKPITADGATCYGGLQADTNIGFSLLGDVFLKAVFTVFDSRGPKVGFAQQTGVDATPFSPSTGGTPNGGSTGGGTTGGTTGNGLSDWFHKFFGGLFGGSK